MNKEEKWYILGAGAIGCLCAFAFNKANIPCQFIIRPQSRKKYQAQQITVEEDGYTSHYPAYQSTPDEIKEPINNLLITVKAADAVNAVESIAPTVAPNATVIILINGMGFHKKIADILPGRNILLGSTTHGAWVKEPLHICYAGKGKTWIGPLDHNLTETPLSLPNVPMLDIQISDNIELRLWEKLIINCLINGLTARYNCQNGALISTEKYLQRLEKLANECTAVLQKLNIALSKTPLELGISAIKCTANNWSSTWQDVKNNKKTELPWINGYLISEGKRLGIVLYEHQRLMNELQQMHML